MAAAHKDRIERLARLVRLLPGSGRDEECPDSGLLLARMGEDYADGTSPKARRRAIQRDLEELVRDGRIEPANPGGKPLRYRRTRETDPLDPYLADYAQKLTRSLVREALPARRFEGLWQHVLDPHEGLGLGEDKFRVVSDTQRLLAADIYPEVLATVLEALAKSRTLKASYRDATDKATEPLLHPQALLQRGPRVYLFALKNDEAEPVRMYALHRMIRCSLGSEAARQAPDFDLQQSIDRGYADFGDGQDIRVVLRARGYVAELLRDCPLSMDQRIEDEDDASDFAMRIHAAVPATGQLLRWILGCGANVEVVEPAHLRRIVAVQAAKMAGIYPAEGG